MPIPKELDLSIVLIEEGELHKARLSIDPGELLRFLKAHSIVLRKQVSVSESPNRTMTQGAADCHTAC